VLEHKGDGHSPLSLTYLCRNVLRAHDVLLWPWEFDLVPHVVSTFVLPGKTLTTTGVEIGVGGHVHMHVRKAVRNRQSARASRASASCGVAPHAL
jgi:hypothetical protein